MLWIFWLFISCSNLFSPSLGSSYSMVNSFIAPMEVNIMRKTASKCAPIINHIPFHIHSNWIPLNEGATTLSSKKVKIYPLKRSAPGKFNILITTMLLLQCWHYSLFKRPKVGPLFYKIRWQPAQRIKDQFQTIAWKCRFFTSYTSLCFRFSS